MITATVITRRLLARFGVRTLLLTGLCFVGLGQAWLYTISKAGSYQVNVLGGVMLTAFGMGLVFPTVSVAVTSGIGAGERGLAGGLLVTAQQVGQAIGLAALATIAAARTSAHGGSLVSGYKVTFLVSAGIVVVAILIVVILMRDSSCARRDQLSPDADGRLTRTQGRDQPAAHRPGRPCRSGRSRGRNRGYGGGSRSPCVVTEVGVEGVPPDTAPDGEAGEPGDGGQILHPMVQLVVGGVTTQQDAVGGPPVALGRIHDRSRILVPVESLHLPDGRLHAVVLQIFHGRHREARPYLVVVAGPVTSDRWRCRRRWPVSAAR